MAKSRSSIAGRRLAPVLALAIAAALLAACAAPGEEPVGAEETPTDERSADEELPPVEEDVASGPLALPGDCLPPSVIGSDFFWYADDSEPVRYAGGLTCGYETGGGTYLFVAIATHDDGLPPIDGNGDWVQQVVVPGADLAYAYSCQPPVCGVDAWAGGLSFGVQGQGIDLDTTVDIVARVIARLGAQS